MSTATIQMPEKGKGRGKPPIGAWGNFVARRRELGWSQNDAARHFGVSQTTISAWETLARRPDVEYLLPLTRFLDLPADKLLGFLSEKFLPATTR